MCFGFGLYAGTEVKEELILGMRNEAEEQELKRRSHNQISWEKEGKIVADGGQTERAVVTPQCGRVRANDLDCGSSFSMKSTQTLETQAA